MRDTDVEINPNAWLVTVTLCARSRQHAFDAIAYADTQSIPGYRLFLVEIRPYRPRGGRKRRVVLHFVWTEKPEVHEYIRTWEEWAKLLETSERLARGRS